MTLKQWKEHMGNEFFNLDTTSRRVVMDNHLYNDCPDCKARKKTRQRELNRKFREEAMLSVGLVKCKVNGKTFWE